MDRFKGQHTRYSHHFNHPHKKFLKGISNAGMVQLCGVLINRQKLQE